MASSLMKHGFLLSKCLLFLYNSLSIKTTTRVILDEIRSVLERIDEKAYEDFLSAILNAKSVFVTGQGRSGLVSRSFAMRLTHIGLNAYCVGDATTPNLNKGDLLIAC